MWRNACRCNLFNTKYDSFMTKVAIIGAGLSGITAALYLNNLFDISIFEKSRGVGGRITTRYADPFYFDHGAQFFIAKDEKFKDFIKPMIEQKIIQRWDAKFVEIFKSQISQKWQWNDKKPHYVGSPGMNAISKYLAKSLNIHLNTTISRLVNKNPPNQPPRWQLFDQQDQLLGTFDWVICTAPAPQAGNLLPSQFAHHEPIKQTNMLPCYSLMLGFYEPLNLDFDAALIKGADISWISVNSRKPGRHQAFSLLIHSTNQWAQSHLEDDQQAVIKYLSDQTSQSIGLDVSQADHQTLHRWRYANMKTVYSEKSLVDDKNQLIACGDWCIQGRIEAAFISGLSAANAVKKATMSL